MILIRCFYLYVPHLFTTRWFTHRTSFLVRSVCCEGLIDALGDCSLLLHDSMHLFQLVSAWFFYVCLTFLSTQCLTYGTMFLVYSVCRECLIGVLGDCRLLLHYYTPVLGLSETQVYA